LLAREAEAASWSQRRQLFGTSRGGGVGGKRDIVNHWVAPTMGFPPMTPVHHFRPLHVWGHHPMEQSYMHMWPKYSPHQPPANWAAPAQAAPPPNASYWHQRVSNLSFKLMCIAHIIKLWHESKDLENEIFKFKSL
jgi:hypothetical protein